MSQKPSRIDPRITRTRKLLIESFFALMAEKHFDDITVQDITTRATVNRATFYAHFTDKYALVNDIIGEQFQGTLESRLAEPAEDHTQRLRRLFLAVTDHLEAVNGHCKAFYQVFESIAESQVRTRLHRNVHGWLADREDMRDRTEQHREMVATILTWSIYGAAQQWSRSNDGRSAEQYADEALPVIMPGEVPVST